jgi:hypothetical protein
MRAGRGAQMVAVLDAFPLTPGAKGRGGVPFPPLIRPAPGPTCFDWSRDGGSPRRGGIRDGNASRGVDFPGGDRRLGGRESASSVHDEPERRISL